MVRQGKNNKKEQIKFILEQRKAAAENLLAQYLCREEAIIPRNSELFKLAPPTKNPSTSFCLASSSQFAFFTDPE
jgi:hypothetical protein